MTGRWCHRKASLPLFWIPEMPWASHFSFTSVSGTLGLLRSPTSTHHPVTYLRRTRDTVLLVPLPLWIGDRVSMVLLLDESKLTLIEL